MWCFLDCSVKDENFICKYIFVFLFPENANAVNCFGIDFEKEFDLIQASYGHTGLMVNIIFNFVLFDEILFM